MTGKEMVKLLKEHGWEVDRISGSHHIMIKGRKTWKKGYSKPI